MAIQLSHRITPHLLKLLACAAGSAAFQITPLGASETGYPQLCGDQIAIVNMILVGYNSGYNTNNSDYEYGYLMALYIYIYVYIS